MWDCTGGSNQKWTLKANGSVAGEGSGRCLDPVGQGSSNGTPLQLLDCKGSANQKWRFK
jgi:Ricin-type beta-trefoil lectin domain